MRPVRPVMLISVPFRLQLQLKLQFGIDAFEEGKTLFATDNNSLMVRLSLCCVVPDVHSLAASHHHTVHFTQKTLHCVLKPAVLCVYQTVSHFTAVNYKFRVRSGSPEFEWRTQTDIFHSH
jgi:hypothetical protein